MLVAERLDSAPALVERIMSQIDTSILAPMIAKLQQWRTANLFDSHEG
jgi:hypothetical protein